MTTQHGSPTPFENFPAMAQSLAAPFRKDAGEEFFLDDLNQRLAAAHDQELVERPELFPTLHVVGPPRSGTTLLMQLLAAHLEVGYINNLIAAFWRAPLYGIRLSKKLCPRPADTRFVSSYPQALASNRLFCRWCKGKGSN